MHLDLCLDGLTNGLRREMSARRPGSARLWGAFTFAMLLIAELVSETDKTRGDLSWPCNARVRPAQNERVVE